MFEVQITQIFLAFLIMRPTVYAAVVGHNDKGANIAVETVLRHLRSRPVEYSKNTFRVIHIQSQAVAVNQIYVFVGGF